MDIDAHLRRWTRADCGQGRRDCGGWSSPKSFSLLRLLSPSYLGHIMAYTQAPHGVGLDIHHSNPTKVTNASS